MRISLYSFKLSVSAIIRCKVTLIEISRRTSVFVIIVYQLLCKVRDLNFSRNNLALRNVITWH